MVTVYDAKGKIEAERELEDIQVRSDLDYVLMITGGDENGTEESN